MMTQKRRLAGQGEPRDQYASDIVGPAFKPDEATISAQAVRVLRALQDGPKTTADLRGLLGSSSSPAARVLDLRKAGHHITTERSGHQARYVLAEGVNA